MFTLFFITFGIELQYQLLCLVILHRMYKVTFIILPNNSLYVIIFREESTCCINTAKIKENFVMHLEVRI